MCALEKMAANTTHYKTLLSPVTPSPHVSTLINDRFILTTSRRECSVRVQILPQRHGTKRKKSNLIRVCVRSRAFKYLDIYCSFNWRCSCGCSQSRPDNCPWIGMQMALNWHQGLIVVNLAWGTKRPSASVVTGTLWTGCGSDWLQPSTKNRCLWDCLWLHT